MKPSTLSFSDVQVSQSASPPSTWWPSPWSATAPFATRWPPGRGRPNPTPPRSSPPPGWRAPSWCCPTPSLAPWSLLPASTTARGTCAAWCGPTTPSSSPGEQKTSSLSHQGAVTLNEPTGDVSQPPYWFASGKRRPLLASQISPFKIKAHTAQIRSSALIENKRLLSLTLTLTQMCPLQVRVSAVAALPDPRHRHDDSVRTHLPGAVQGHQVRAVQQEVQQRYECKCNINVLLHLWMFTNFSSV